MVRLTPVSASLPLLATVTLLLLTLVTGHNNAVHADTDVVSSTAIIATAPDSTSFVTCDSLLTSPYITFGTSINCSISCRNSGTYAQGSLSDYHFDIESIPLPALNLAPADASDPPQIGSIAKMWLSDDQLDVFFTFQAGTAAGRGILRACVTLEGVDQDIVGSPIVFEVIPPPPQTPTPSSSWSISSILIIAGVTACVVIVIAAAAKISVAYRRKALELKQQSSRTEQWVHSVPDVNAMLQSSDISGLSSPLLR